MPAGRCGAAGGHRSSSLVVMTEKKSHWSHTHVFLDPPCPDMACGLSLEKQVLLLHLGDTAEGTKPSRRLEGLQAGASALPVLLLASTTLVLAWAGFPTLLKHREPGAVVVGREALAQVLPSYTNEHLEQPALSSPSPLVLGCVLTLLASGSGAPADAAGGEDADDGDGNACDSHRRLPGSLQWPQRLTVPAGECHHAPTVPGLLRPAQSA